MSINIKYFLKSVYNTNNDVKVIHSFLHNILLFMANSKTITMIKMCIQIYDGLLSSKWNKQNNTKELACPCTHTY